MKKLFVLFILAALFSSCETMMKSGGSVYGSGTGTRVSENEADLGIREALAQGVVKGIAYLNKTDGFFGNETYKLFLPDDAVRVGNTLRAIGLGSQVDKAILQINRSAEDAVGYAKPIFVDAIKEMTVADALSIVQGPNNSATNYFREKTRARLVEAFSPAIRGSLDKTNATRFYSDMVNTYNKMPTTFTKLNPDLVSYVAEHATNALFDQIEKEEINIRQNPVARGTEILRKVFGTKSF
jgi:hypothetical protein